MGLFVAPVFAASLSLEWTDPVPTVAQAAPTGHKVYRSIDAVVCDNLMAGLPLYATIPTMSSTYTDTAVPAVNGKVCYEVTAFNAGGESVKSSRAGKATTINPPPAPTGLVIR
jgi:hypothetical protein